MTGGPDDLRLAELEGEVLRLAIEDAEEVLGAHVGEPPDHDDDYADLLGAVADWPGKTPEELAPLLRQTVADTIYVSRGAVARGLVLADAKSDLPGEAALFLTAAGRKMLGEPTE